MFDRVEYLLCNKCNKALGLLGSTEVVQKALDYLKNPPLRKGVQ